MRTIEKQGMVREQVDEAYKAGSIQVRAMTEAELREYRGDISCRIQLLQYVSRIQYCKAELVPNAIMGTLAIPNKKELLGRRITVGYYMDGAQFLLVGDEKETDMLWGFLEKHELRKEGTTADVLIDFLNMLVDEEVPFLQRMEEKLSKMEEGLLERIPGNFYQTVIRYRRQLLTLHTYYEQLINMTDMIQSNHNEILSGRECQRMASFGARAERLHGHVEMLREYVLQIREMYQTQIDVSQNHTMNLLTVVTSLFLPLSLLVGWYGMNFVDMPELHWRYSYPVLIGISALILILEVRFFRKKGLL